MFSLGFLCIYCHNCCTGFGEDEPNREGKIGSLRVSLLMTVCSCGVCNAVMLNIKVVLSESCVCYAIDKKAENGGWEPGSVSK